MSGRIGVELTPTRLRAVVLSSWRGRVVRTADVAWDPQHPNDGVRALRESLASTGAPESIALAIGVPLLHVARVSLPPVPDESREAMLALEPSRYFATTEPVVVALAAGSEAALALDANRADAWCSAFEEWGSIARCEGAPSAIARALPPATSGVFSIGGDGESEERGIIELRDGRVASVRRLASTSSGDHAPSLPSSGGVSMLYLAALGAARGGDAPSVGVLADPARRRAFRARAARRLATAAVASVAAISFAVLAFDQWRDRTLVAFEAEAARLAVQARPALDAQARLAALTHERATLDDAALRRADPAAALAAIGRALPREAVVLSARAIGDDWRLDGTSSNAAALVPALDADGGFENVRFLSASSRFQDGTRVRETFSIALRVHPKP